MSMLEQATIIQSIIAHQSYKTRNGKVAYTISQSNIKIYNFTGYPNNFQWPNLIGRFNGDYTNQTEFIGGDYGMDEEYYDGLDNDGDGLFDEDVGEIVPSVILRSIIIDQLQELGLRGN